MACETSGRKRVNSVNYLKTFLRRNFLTDSSFKFLEIYNIHNLYIYIVFVFLPIELAITLQFQIFKSKYRDMNLICKSLTQTLKNKKILILYYLLL